MIMFARVIDGLLFVADATTSACAVGLISTLVTQWLYMLLKA